MESARTSIGSELERFAANTLEYIQQGGAAHVRAAHAAADPHQVRRPPRARGRARSRLPLRPRRAALVHPRVPAGAHRRRRRRRRAARARAHARHHHRRLRLGVGEGASRAAPSSCTTCIPTVVPRAVRSCSSGASTTSSSWPRAPVRTSPCSSPTRRAQLIVAVGTHATMVEFLDKGRPGMASTFLTRLRLGPDARRRQGREPPLRRPGPAPRHRAARRRGTHRDHGHGIVVAIVARVHLVASASPRTSGSRSRTAFSG